jgi:RNA-binding protein
MTPLKGSQRRHLRGLAHSYSPAVQIGKEGLTEPVIAAIDASLAAHELIKVKIAADRGGRQAVAGEIEAHLGCECVGAVGHMAIFYRRHPDPEHRRIVLPR